MHINTTGRRGSVCIYAKIINSRVRRATLHSTMYLRVTCLQWFNAELRKAQIITAVLVGGSDISTACHPPSLYEESLTSTLTSMVGRDQEAAPKPDGLIQSSTTSTQLASIPSMPHIWYMTDPSGRPLFPDCQRSNPSMALAGEL